MIPITIKLEKRTEGEQKAYAEGYKAGKEHAIRNGQWVPIKRGKAGYSAGDFKCTECGKPNKCYSLTPFCPNCGASMRGE